MSACYVIKVRSVRKLFLASWRKVLILTIKRNNMAKTKVAETTIKEKLNHDSMWIRAQFPSGAHFKFHVNRNGETLELAFSNDTSILRNQQRVFMKWMDLRAEIEREEREKTGEAVAEAKGMAASSTTVYVEYGNIFGYPVPDEVNRLNSFLEELGLKNMNISFRSINEKFGFLVEQKYVAVNFEKGAFVASTTNYHHPVVSAEDFMETHKGRKARTKFGM